MGISDAVGDFKYDLLNSWYFRIWLVCFIVCFSVDIAAIAKFHQKAEDPAEKNAMRQFWYHPSSVQFPTFQFFTFRDDTGETFDQASFKCYHGKNNRDNPAPSPGLLLQKSQCDAFDGHPAPSMDECIQIKTDSVFASPPEPGSFHSSSDVISCSFELIGNADNYDIDHTVGYHLTPQGGFVGGDTPFVLTLIPCNRTHISQRVMSIQDGKKSVSDWHLELQHVEQPNFHRLLFGIEISVDAFGIMILKTGDWFTGWESAGACGGFWFLVYCVFIAFMGIIGLFIPSDTSRCLARHDKNNQMASDDAEGVDDYGRGSFGTQL